MDRIILHADCNNFYASVECLYHPELRGKPLAVAGDPEARHGIVLAKNNEAKKFGVKTGNPLWLAKQLCPDIVFVPPTFQRYLKFSQKVREIFLRYTDQVESFGLDESWLDVTGSSRLFGEGKKIADELREKIKYELGITISVGVSYNKIFAKLGSDLKKPDATTQISREHFREIVWPLPVGDLLYVGPATERKLCSSGIRTIGALATAPKEYLNATLGKFGTMLWVFANGYDLSPVAPFHAQPQIKSVGNSTTTPRDLVTDQDVKITLYILCESVAERLREQNLQCATVQVYLRYNDLLSCERQMKLETPVCNSKGIFLAAYKLYKENRIQEKPIRSIGVRGCDLSLYENIQTSFFSEIESSHKQDNLEQAMDDIRRRFGHFSIQRGVSLSDKTLSQLDPKHDHVIHPVSFLA